MLLILVRNFQSGILMYYFDFSVLEVKQYIYFTATNAIWISVLYFFGS